MSFSKIYRGSNGNFNCKFFSNIYAHLFPFSETNKLIKESNYSMKQKKK